MTSGIYKLTFSSGDTYIGKSINIDTRWDQHRDKLIKGKGAKAMQRAYELYGFPMGEILFECHPDHIDIVESCFISRFKPTLNGTRPEDPLAMVEDDSMDTVLGYLKYSTLEHIIAMNDYKKVERKHMDKLETLQRENTNLQKLVSDLQRRRDEEEIAQDIDKRIKRKDAEIKELNLDLEALEVREKILIKKVAQLSRPWWQKLFD